MVCRPGAIPAGGQWRSLISFAEPRHPETRWTVSAGLPGLFVLFLCSQVDHSIPHASTTFFTNWRTFREQFVNLSSPSGGCLLRHPCTGGSSLPTARRRKSAPHARPQTDKTPGRQLPPGSFYVICTAQPTPSWIHRSLYRVRMSAGRTR